jgi:hypothetical protein
MLFGGIFSQTNMKVSPSLQGENPLAVVLKLNAQWVKVPYVIPGPIAQNKNKKGLAPQQQTKNNRRNNPKASAGNKTGDPQIKTTIGYISSETSEKSLLCHPIMQLESLLAKAQRYTIPMGNRKLLLRESLRIIN